MGSPGGRVSIEGTGLGSVAAVAFEPCGRPGSPVTVAPISAIETKIWLAASTLGLGPTQSLGVGGAGLLSTSPFHFAGNDSSLEQTEGDLLTLGQGTTTSSATTRTDRCRCP